MSKYDVVLFDLDGTVIDSIEGILNSINYSFRNVGIEETDEEKLLPLIGPPIVHTLQLHYGMTEAEANHTMTFYHKYYSEEGWKQFSLYEGIEELIKELKKQGKKIGMATNKPKHYAEKIMEYKNLHMYFDYIGGSNFEKGITNKKLVILDCLDKMGTSDKSKALMVGDRHYDIDGATEAGIDAIGITYGYGDKDELIEAGAIKVFNTTKNIIEFLE